MPVILATIDDVNLNLHQMDLYIYKSGSFKRSRKSK